MSPLFAGSKKESFLCRRSQREGKKFPFQAAAVSDRVKYPSAGLPQKILPGLMAFPTRRVGMFIEMLAKERRYDPRPGSNVLNVQCFL